MEKLMSSFFPFWNKLTQEYKEEMLASCQQRLLHKGDIIMPYKGECLGLILMKSGQVRAFVTSEQGKEVTLYRLYEYDICIFSASCIMNNIQFDIQIEIEKDTDAIIVPSDVYESIIGKSVDMANYTNQLISSRFSEVMWTLEQIMFKSMDYRIAQFLLTSASNEQTDELSITHDAIARNLGTAREVVTRMLKYFSEENLIELKRGKVKLLDMDRLQKIGDA